MELNIIWNIWNSKYFKEIVEKYTKISYLFSTNSNKPPTRAIIVIFPILVAVVFCSLHARAHTTVLTRALCETTGVDVNSPSHV